MNRPTNIFWEVGPLISSQIWNTSESLESPVLKTKDGTSWWLEFYPAGDEGNPDSLVFWLNRNNSHEQVTVVFDILFCFFTTPVRQYSLKHTFEKEEDIHKWIVDDVKNLAQLKIFIPLSTLCFSGYFRVHESCKTLIPQDKCECSKDVSDEINLEILL